MSNPHTLTANERGMSQEAFKQLGIKCNVFCDGNWICDPHSKDFKMGYGSTPDEAIADCAKENNIQIKQK